MFIAKLRDETWQQMDGHNLSIVYSFYEC